MLLPRLASLLAAVAAVQAKTQGANISSLPNGLWRVPIDVYGVINYTAATPFMIQKPGAAYSHRQVVRPRIVEPVDVNVGNYDNGKYDEYDDEEFDAFDEFEPYDDEQAHKGNQTVSVSGNDNETMSTSDYGDHYDSDVDVLGRAHCHAHFPHRHNRYITGHQLLKLDDYPLTLSMFMEWIETGPDGGWLERGEVRMAKSGDIVVGACIFKRKRLRMCTHELSMAMAAADRECAAGKVGCHACMRNWHKDYFRFAADEAPNQCECAWYYWS